MKIRSILFLLFLFSGICLLGQARPFPQSVDYPNGYQANGISADTVRAMYERWKSEFIRECNGMYRVRCTDDTTETRSEGMGYGMLLSAYFGEKGVFDSLFAFYKSKRTNNAYNLMAWQVTCGGIKDQGSATDGDLDVAFALLVADDQWGGDYLEEADSIFSILKEHYFVSCGELDIYVMKPGGQFGGCGLTDMSYYTPAYFVAFGDQTNDDFWYDVAEHSYAILDSGSNSGTGLVRDWQSWDGNAVSGWDSTYSYDACRVPWRMALDYIWNGNYDAEFWCSKISDFANGIGASNIVDGYYLDGTPCGSYNNSSFVGGFAVGGMCHSQEMVDEFASHLLSLDGRSGEDRYFNFSLRCLYMLVLTGNFWQPDPNSSFVELNPLPEKFYLKQNDPNPFVMATTIEYSIAEAGFVKLAIYDVSGREVKNLVEEVMPAGNHTFDFDAKGLSPGIYFYQLKAGVSNIQKKMILLK
jgi:endo-1,4-beta-D-glucanase Y